MILIQRFVVIPISLLTIAFSAMADVRSEPISGPMQNATAYATLDQAAMAALKICRQNSRRVEWGGCLYSINGSFYFTEPITNNSEDDFKARCRMPKNSMIGLFHTHPVGSAEGFSDHDLKLAKKLNLVSYILSIPSSKVMRSSPGKRTRYGSVIGKIR